MDQKSYLGLTTGGFHRVSYTEWGKPNGSPPVVCVHGLTRNSRDFDYLAAMLQRDGRYVACPDIVGRGRSDWLTDKNHYTFATYCADFTALLARLDSETFDWIGTSLGGLIGIFMAAQPNSPIRRLVLNDAGPFIPKEAPRRLLTYVGTTPKFASMEEAEQYYRNILVPYGKLNNEHWAHLTRHSVRPRAEGGYEPLYDPGIAVPMKAVPIADLNLWPVWDQIRCPVLVLRGAESDVLLKETAEKMKTRGPQQVDVVEFEGVGHAPPLLAAKHINVVREWLLNPL
jgi:pimeloyl-ACP methyl ester carboxylesterase